MAEPFVARFVARWMRPLRHASPGRQLGRLAAGLAAAALLVGCQEKLTAPGICPESCPGGQLAVVDTILDAIPGQDSSFAGYLAAGAGEALLVSSGLPSSEDRAAIRFRARPDSILISTVWYHYQVDSVAFTFNVRGRDTLTDNVKAVLYRLPRTLDSTATFAGVEGNLIDANVIDTVPISNDSVNFTVRAVVRGSDLASVVIPTTDSGVLAIGMRITAPQPTGLRIGTIATDLVGATFTSYVTLPTVPDTIFRHQTLGANAAFNTFVSQGTPAFDNDHLAVGGEPSARALLRFNFSPKLRDSVSIVRATLELIPVQPMYGLPNDPTLIEIRPLLADLGAKSPLCIVGGGCGNALLSAPTLIQLAEGSADTVHFEVPRIVRTWQGTATIPAALMLSIRPEAATFMRPVFFSTRSGIGAPRLRISYVPLLSAGSP